MADRDLVESDADAAKAVQQVAAHIEALGELVENSGSGKTRIPATDIEALIALAPDLASKIRVGSGSIIVTTYLGDVLVTPDIDDESGLIEVHLSKFAWATNEPIVRELIRALNSGVDGRDARFQMISVTPDGIVLEARARSEDVR